MNSAFCEFLMQHSLLLLFGYIMLDVVVSTAVHSLPAPREDSSQGYIFTFTFCNAIFRNVSALRGLSRLVELETPTKLKANSVQEAHAMDTPSYSSRRPADKS